MRNKSYIIVAKRRSDGEVFAYLNQQLRINGEWKTYIFHRSVAKLYKAGVHTRVVNKRSKRTFYDNLFKIERRSPERIARAAEKGRIMKAEYRTRTYQHDSLYSRLTADLNLLQRQYPEFELFISRCGSKKNPFSVNWEEYHNDRRHERGNRSLNLCKLSSGLIRVKKHE